MNLIIRSERRSPYYKVSLLIYVIPSELFRAAFKWRKFNIHEYSIKMPETLNGVEGARVTREILIETLSKCAPSLPKYPYVSPLKGL